MLEIGYVETTMLVSCDCRNGSFAVSIIAGKTASDGGSSTMSLVIDDNDLGCYPVHDVPIDDLDEESVSTALSCRGEAH